MIQLQLLCVLFALAMLYWIYASYRRGAMRLPELVLWVLVWGGFAALSLFPQSATVIVQRLHVNRTMDLVMILAFMVISAVLFLNHLELRRLQHRLQDLVRELALREGGQP